MGILNEDSSNMCKVQKAFCFAKYCMLNVELYSLLVITHSVTNTNSKPCCLLTLLHFHESQLKILMYVSTMAMCNIYHVILPSAL